MQATSSLQQQGRKATNAYRTWSCGDSKRRTEERHTTHTCTQKELGSEITQHLSRSTMNCSGRIEQIAGGEEEEAMLCRTAYLAGFFFGTDRPRALTETFRLAGTSNRVGGDWREQSQKQATDLHIHGNHKTLTFGDESAAFILVRGCEIARLTLIGWPASRPIASPGPAPACRRRRRLVDAWQNLRYAQFLSQN